MAVRNDIEVPAGYRMLDSYERIKTGDKILYSPNETGGSTVLIVGEDDSNTCYVGMRQSLLCGMAVRPLEKSEWINKKDRMPTEADYKGGNGNIQVWLEGKNHPLHLMKISVEKGGYNFTYWRPVPPIPKPVEVPIIVKESNGKQHGVVFRKDGSLVVGCTEISSELFYQIAQRRQEKMQCK